MSPLSDAEYASLVARLVAAVCCFLNPEYVALGGTAFTFLTSGVFLSGFAMYMGASDLLVSYISMITNICGVSILFFSGLIGRFRSFKKITVSLTILSKLATLDTVPCSKRWRFNVHFGGSFMGQRDWAQIHPAISTACPCSRYSGYGRS